MRPLPPTDHPARLPWYRVPVAWIGIVVFAASLAGCVWMVVLSQQYRDDPAPDSAPAILGVPAQRSAPPR